MRACIISALVHTPDGVAVTPERFALSFDSPFFVEICESVLQAADALGVHVVWARVIADRLEFDLSEQLPQSEIVDRLIRNLSSSNHAEQSSPCSARSFSETIR